MNFVNPLFSIPIKRTKDGGKTHYYNYYFCFPFFRGLRFYSYSFKQLSKGIWFYYKGDEVLWAWPWRRSIFSQKWISLCTEGAYNSLNQLDKFWLEYNDFVCQET